MLLGGATRGRHEQEGEKEEEAPKMLLISCRCAANIVNISPALAHLWCSTSLTLFLSLNMLFICMSSLHSSLAVVRENSHSRETEPECSCQQLTNMNALAGNRIQWRVDKD